MLSVYRTTRISHLIVALVLAISVSLVVQGIAATPADAAACYDRNVYRYPGYAGGAQDRVGAVRIYVHACSNTSTSKWSFTGMSARTYPLWQGALFVSGRRINVRRTSTTKTLTMEARVRDYIGYHVRFRYDVHIRKNGNQRPIVSVRNVRKVGGDAQAQYRLYKHRYPSR